MSLTRDTRSLFWVLSKSAYLSHMLCIWRLLHAASNVKLIDRFFLFLIFLVYSFSFTFTSSDSARAQSIALELVANNLANPVAITHAGDGSGRLFITLQDGQIVIYNGTQILPTPFLDISSLVSCCGERGLLSVAFHPNYVNNGFVYVNYTDNNGNTVIARYTVSANPNIANPSSAFILLTIQQPFSNHNGGQLQFGPDGYLYIGMGDGGSGGDPQDNAQNLGTLLGKMLRINVNGDDFPTDPNRNYSIPSDNPFVGITGLDEIWALGFRNPWRFSFDLLTDDLFIGDVGQNNFEEIDFQPASSNGGENYGWRCYEGNSAFNTSGCSPASNYEFPIFEYSHAEGCSVTGGYRYRGNDFPGLFGIYFSGDFCSGKIWGTTQNGSSWTTNQLLDTSLSISSYGEDETGEIYLAHYSSPDGAIYHIVSAGGGGSCVGTGSFRIRGKVARSPRGVISGVALTINGPSACTDTTTNDSRGKYQFQMLGNGTYIITPGKAGCSFTPSSPTVTISGSSQTVNFTGSCP